MGKRRRTTYHNHVLDDSEDEIPVTPPPIFHRHTRIEKADGVAMSKHTLYTMPSSPPVSDVYDPEYGANDANNDQFLPGVDAEHELDGNEEGNANCTRVVVRLKFDPRCQNVAGNT
jgi:hypothetical protein